MERFFLIMGFVISIPVLPQSNTLVSNQNMYTNLYNPAFLGNEKSLDFSFLARKQWVGFANAPFTQIFTFDTHLDKIKSGVGVIIYNDAIGQENTLLLKLNYNYKIHFGQYFNVVAGLGGGPVSKRFNAGNLIYEEVDPAGSYESYASFLPELSAGIRLNYINCTAGLAVTSITDNKKNDIDIHYPFFYTGYFEFTYEINRDLKIKPGLSYYHSLKSNTIMGGSQVVYRENYWFGLMYRHLESLSGLLGCKLGEKIIIEYAYDFAVGRLHYYHNGSHEFYLKISLQKKEKEYFYHKSPRFF